MVDGDEIARPQTFFPGTPPAAWEDLCNPAGDLLMGAGGLLVQISGRRVLIDAGAGVMASSLAFGRADSGSMPDTLATLGVRLDDIDILAFTHLHFDHTGWAFTRGARTFPNARYALAAQEWAAYADGLDDGVPTPRHVVDQLRSGKHDFELFNDGDEIVPGVRGLVAVAASGVTSAVGQILTQPPAWISVGGAGPLTGGYALRRSRRGHNMRH